MAHLPLRIHICGREVDLVNILIEGAAQLVKWETMLDAGEGSAVPLRASQDAGTIIIS